jgi:DNA-directed RNA polymerase subunit RPC12/RpoP
MESKLLKEWMSKGLKISTDFEFYTKRDYIVVGKLKGQPAIAEYECPYCKHYEITHNVNLEKTKTGKKFQRPKIKCSGCGKTIIVESLKKV